MTDKEPQLIFEAVPQRSRKGGESKYAPKVREFNESGAPSARVEVTGVAFQAIASGLKTAIGQLGLGDTLSVTNRAGSGVYLIRKEAPKK